MFEDLEMENHHKEVFRVPEDGTILAEIQDLRRYLLLIEAEYRSRQAKQNAEPPTPVIRRKPIRKSTESD